MGDCEVVRWPSEPNGPDVGHRVYRWDIYSIRVVPKLNVIYLQSFSKWQTLNIVLRMCHSMPLFSMILLFNPTIPNDETFVIALTSHRDQPTLSGVESEWKREG